MTYKEKFDNETDWKKKVLIVEFFHLTQCMKRKKWRVRDTARVFEKSIGLISENLMLAEAIRNEIIRSEDTRQQALNALKLRKRIIIIEVVTDDSK